MLFADDWLMKGPVCRWSANERLIDFVLSDDQSPGLDPGDDGRTINEGLENEANGSSNHYSFGC